MIFRFIMLSDEVDNFKREYKLDSESTFLDLRNIIVESVGYDKSEMSSFFICGDDWSKEKEITLVDMGTKSEEDSYIMEESVLGDFLEDERQKLMFEFDYLNERAFFMELREIMFGESIDAPEITKSVGNAPQQMLFIEEEVAVPVVVPLPVPDEDDDFEDDESETDSFYGEDDYNEDELDDDAFDDFNEEGENSNSEEQEI